MPILSERSHWLLLVILAVAVVGDLRSRRIPNQLIVIGIVSGMATGLLFHSLPGVIHALQGALTALAVFLPFFALRMVGAGDVKLMLVVGTFVGASALLLISLYTFILGGALAIVAVLASGRARQLIDNLRLYLCTIAMRRYGDSGALPDLTVATALRLPYALAIAGGTLFWIAQQSVKTV